MRCVCLVHLAQNVRPNRPQYAEIEIYLTLLRSQRCNKEPYLVFSDLMSDWDLLML